MLMPPGLRTANQPSIQREPASPPYPPQTPARRFSKADQTPFLNGHLIGLTSYGFSAEEFSGDCRSNAVRPLSVDISNVPEGSRIVAGAL